MKQLFLFSQETTTLQESAASDDQAQGPIFSVWKLFVDGASRNNPGLSGAGVYILRDESIAYARGVFLGKKTNNEAEYLALLLGLFELRTMIRKEDLVLIVSDSQLLVRQIAGSYRVKEPRLQQLHAVVKKLLHGMNYTISHVLRENNTHADALANEGIDAKIAAPANFIKFLQQHALSL